ncbi:hypothetical protein [Paenibacillus sp. 276b]|uniref:hypothetical protein n=1 Tax=Paenibacillus sp. 276b TaxID=1566277 RepID=UPI000899C058|nr:hypothetical protein [Paenibacillus sp. 276b]SEB27625.1 hypothetical protein SAMN03159332_6293 [Paenibacillus sp. 276b]
MSNLNEIALDLDKLIAYKEFINMELDQQHIYMRHWRLTKTNEAICKGMEISTNTLHRRLIILNLLGKKGIPIRHDDRGHKRFKITEDIILTYEEFKALEQHAKTDVAKTLFRKYTISEIAENWGIDPKSIYNFRSHIFKNGVAKKAEMQPKSINPNINVVINFLEKNNSIIDVNVVIEKLHKLVEQSESIPNNVLNAYLALSAQNKWLLLEMIVSRKP